MNRRLAVLELRNAFQLNPEAGQQLETLAGLDEAPPALSRLLSRGLFAGGFALLGLGLILWLAANWPDFGRATKFILLQSVVVIATAGALRLHMARSALLLLAFLAQGGTLAFFGQTYQTGADAWQLFALWAAIGLPLALAARSDVLWLPLSLVLATAISLWTQAHTGHSWSFHVDAQAVYYLGWLLSLGLLALLCPFARLRRLTGAGHWAYRGALLCFLTQLVFTALLGLFDHTVRLHFSVGLGVAVIVCLLACRKPLYDIFALSAAGLGVDVLAIAGLARLVLDHGNEMFNFLFLGLLSAGLVAGTASLVWKVARHHHPHEATPEARP